MLLLGEIPGTQELPQLIALVVEHALELGLDVIVGLEIPMTEDVSDPIKAGTGPFFCRAADYQDGRSSAAMAELVAQLTTRRGALQERANSHDDQHLEIVAMDGPWVAPGSPVPLESLGILEQPRNDVMASNLLAVMDNHPRAFTVVVAGPMHTRVDRNAERSLGQIIAAWHPTAVALRVTPAGGQTWILTESGTGQVAELPNVDVPPGALWAPEPGADGHHGVLNPGAVSASSPGSALA